MSIPIRQHYIPRMLLKRFVDRDGKLHFFTNHAPDKGVLASTPENLFLQKHLYTQVDEVGTKDASVETSFLANLEGKADPIVEKIVSAARRGDTPNLSVAEKEVWVEFTYIQFKRVPERREKNKEEIFEEIRREIDFIRQFRRISDHELSILDDEETMERLWRNISIQSVQQPLSREGAEIFLEKRIGVAVIRKPNPKRSFIVGSNPVVKMSNPGRSHLADPTVELWLPLARDVAVSPCPGERDKVIYANDRHIREINKSISQQSTVIAGCSREIIESVLDEGERTSRSTAET